MAQYDVVIVGSGIAGAILAKTLTQAGKSVLLLEAGLKAGISLSPEASYKTYQGYLQTYYETDAKVPNAPYPDIKNAPSSDVLNIQAQNAVQQGQLPGATGTTAICQRQYARTGRNHHALAWQYPENAAQ